MFVFRFVHQCWGLQAFSSFSIFSGNLIFIDQCLMNIRIRMTYSPAVNQEIAYDQPDPDISWWKCTVTNWSQYFVPYGQTLTNTNATNVQQSKCSEHSAEEEEPHTTTTRNCQPFARDRISKGVRVNDKVPIIASNLKKHEELPELKWIILL